MSALCVTVINIEAHLCNTVQGGSAPRQDGYGPSGVGLGSNAIPDGSSQVSMLGSHVPYFFIELRFNVCIMSDSSRVRWLRLAVT